MEPRSISATDDRDVALYHVVYAHETFNASAEAIFALVRNAEEKRPGKSRRLFVDIEGHRNECGTFDDDMLELQQRFLRTFLIRFLSEIHSPLCRVKNPNPQANNLPAELKIEDGNP